MHCNIRLNGVPLPAPDEMRLTWEGGKTEGGARRLSAFIRWAWMDGEDARPVLSAAGGACALTVFDPAAGRERTAEARLIKAEAECLPECCRDVRAVFTEVMNDG